MNSLNKALMSQISDSGVGLRVRSRLEALERRQGRKPRPGLRRGIREVVVIASSSRGGSSMLAEVLRRTQQLLHFRAEVNPFFVLAGLSHPYSGTGSDALDASHATDARADSLEARIAADVGTAATDEESILRFPQDVACRLVLQWPETPFEASDIEAAARELLRQVDPRSDPQRFHVLLLARLNAVHPTINPWYYDVSPELIAEIAPHIPPPDGPPGRFVVEEPPLVAIRPWELAGEEALATRAMIVKTPSNAYRLDFLRAFFPEARFRVLHLRRNAASAINGLVDGWLYRGFFSHAVERPFFIAGYSDLFGPWARHWWKYDLPPGWEEYTHRPLVEVCAFQWHSAHQATFRFLDANPDVDVLPLAFEDVVGPLERRQKAFERMAEWLGIELDPPLERVLREGMPPVMATAAPRQRRWFARAALLDRVLSWPEIKQTMERLGYADDPSTWE